MIITTICGHSGCTAGEPCKIWEASDVAIFAEIVRAEDEARITKAVRDFQTAGVPVRESDRHSRSVESAAARLDALVDSLSPEQMLAFGAYRIAARR